MTQPTLPLPYGTDGAHGLTRRRVKRILLALLAVALVVIAWRYVPRIVAHVRNLSTQERLMQGAPPGRVLFTLDQAEARRLRDGSQPPGGRYKALFGKDGVLKHVPIDNGPESLWATWEPTGYRAFADGVEGPMEREDAPLCTLALTRPDGQRRLIAIEYAVFNVANGWTMDVVANVIQPATLFSAPRAVDRQPYGGTLFKTDNSSSRVLAPTVDPADPSHFTLPYETKLFFVELQSYEPANGVIHVRLGNDDRLTITRPPRPGVLTLKP